MDKLYVVLEQHDDWKQPRLKQAFMSLHDAERFDAMCGSPVRRVWIETYNFDPVSRTFKKEG